MGQYQVEGHEIVGCVEKEISLAASKDAWRTFSKYLTSVFVSALFDAYDLPCKEL